MYYTVLESSETYLRMSLYNWSFDKKFFLSFPTETLRLVNLLSIDEDILSV